MAKPRFNPNEAAARMFLSTPVEQDTQNTQDTQDTQEEQDTHSTQGVQKEKVEKKSKGTQVTQSTHNAHRTHDTQRVQKYPRINMAFYGDNLEFVREESWRRKQSITEYVNDLITQAREKK